MRNLRARLTDPMLDVINGLDAKVFAVGGVSVESIDAVMDSFKGDWAILTGVPGLEDSVAEAGKGNGNMNVYVVNPRSVNFQQVAELTADAIQNPDSTVIALIESTEEPWSEAERTEVNGVRGLFQGFGAKVFDDMESMSAYVNAEVSGDNVDDENGTPGSDDDDGVDRGDESVDGDDEGPADNEGADDDSDDSDDADGDDEGGDDSSSDDDDAGDDDSSDDDADEEESGDDDQGDDDDNAEEEED